MKHGVLFFLEEPGRETIRAWYFQRADLEKSIADFLFGVRFA